MANDDEKDEKDDDTRLAIDTAYDSLRRCYKKAHAQGDVALAKLLLLTQAQVLHIMAEREGQQQIDFDLPGERVAQAIDRHRGETEPER